MISSIPISILLPPPPLPLCVILHLHLKLSHQKARLIQYHNLLQVQKLRILLRELQVPVPKIGSVEEFQGQERKVIILSAVRSNTTLLTTDIRHALGFVASPKRLNVALTRARALLIILGNPHLLTQDPYWRSVLNYCIDRGSYTGCDLPIDCMSLTLDDSV